MGALVVERGEMIVPSMNTAFPKPKMASKQYNSPMKMYSDDIIEEIMTQGTAFGKEIDPGNPWNMTGKEFEPEKSGVLAAMQSWMLTRQNEWTPIITLPKK